MGFEEEEEEESDTNNSPIPQKSYATDTPDPQDHFDTPTSPNKDQGTLVLNIPVTIATIPINQVTKLVLAKKREKTKHRSSNASPPLQTLPKSPTLNPIKKKKVATVSNVDHLADFPVNFQTSIGINDTVEEEDLLDVPKVKKQIKGL